MSITQREMLQLLREENQHLRSAQKQLEEKLRRHEKAIRSLNEIDEMLAKLTRSDQVSELIRRLMLLALHACDSENGSMLLLDSATDELVFVEVIGDSRDALLNYRIDRHEGVVGQSIDQKQAILVDNVRKHDDWSSEVDEAIHFSTRTLMSAPLIHEQRVIGAIEVVNARSNVAFEKIDLDILRLVARLMTLVLHKVEQLRRDE